MIRIHYAEVLSEGDEVLVRFKEHGSFSKYYVRDIKDQFVGLAYHKYSNPSYHKISEIQLYVDEQT